MCVSPPCVSPPCVLGVAASPSEPASSKPSSAPLPVKGLAGGVRAPLPSSLTATSTAHRAPRHTHTHTHTHSGQTGRQTHGLSSSISLACPPPHTRAPSLPRRTGLQGVPSRHPCSPRPGELALPCPPCPGVGGLIPPEPAGAPVTVGLATEIYWIKNKVIFILHVPQSLAASPPSLGVRAGTGARAAFGACLAVCSEFWGHWKETGLPLASLWSGDLTACQGPMWRGARERGRERPPPPSGSPQPKRESHFSSLRVPSPGEARA